MKHAILIPLFIGLCIFNARAQENARKNRGKVTMPGSSGQRTNREKDYLKAITVSLGGGVVTPGSSAKDNAYLVNSPAINADVSFDVKRWVPLPHRPHVALGINVAGTYLLGGSSNPTAPLPTGYAVTGATGSSIAYKGVDPKSPGFIVAAGPQLNIGLGNHFTVSPILPVGYMSITQKALSAVQTTSYNGKDYEFNITSLPQNKISGFSFNPAIRLQYMVTNTIGLWLQGSYLMGPTAKTTTTSLIPNGPAQTPGNTYNLQQLQTATYKQNATVNTKYNAVGFGGGVVISFGSSHREVDGKGRPANMHREVDGKGRPAKLKPPYSPTNPGDPTASVVKSKANQKDNLVLTDGGPQKGWDGTIKSICVKNAVCHLKDANGNCDNGGVLCVSGSLSVKDLDLNVDELLTRISIVKENNTIRVSSDEIFNSVSAKTISKFKNKNIDMVATDFPKENLEKLFQSVQLDLPEGANQFLANEISYNVLDGNIIEIKQSKKIVVDKTNYNFEIVTKILNRTKITKEELEAMNGTKNDKNPVGRKKWTECDGGYQYDCHINADGSISGVPNGKACKGNWSSY